jgi:hypothetical protein
MTGEPLVLATPRAVVTTLPHRSWAPQTTSVSQAASAPQILGFSIRDGADPAEPAISIHNGGRTTRDEALVRRRLAAWFGHANIGQIGPIRLYRIGVGLRPRAAGADLVAPSSFTARPAPVNALVELGAMAILTATGVASGALKAALHVGDDHVRSFGVRTISFFFTTPAGIAGSFRSAVEPGPTASGIDCPALLDWYFRHTDWLHGVANMAAEFDFPYESSGHARLATLTLAKHLLATATSRRD